MKGKGKLKGQQDWYNFHIFVRIIWSKQSTLKLQPALQSLVCCIVSNMC